MIFLICLVWIVSADNKCFEWGTYKPHLMYHYLQKEGPQFGLMYQKPQLRIPLTWKYMNKEYYSTYLLQDFKGTIHSTVRDSNADVEMDIRTINNCRGYWQTQIQVQQGFHYPTINKFPGYYLDLTLYFYHSQPNQEVNITYQDNHYLVTYNDSDWVFKITPTSNNHTKQTVYQPPGSLWKTNYIYQYKTGKKYDFQSGCEILNDSKKPSQQDQYINSKLLKSKYNFKRRPIIGQCRAPNLLMDLKQQCYDEALEHVKQSGLIELLNKPVEIKKDNIGFIQLLMKDQNQIITIECWNKTIGPQSLDFESEFNLRRDNFKRKVQKLFFPHDFQRLMAQILQRSGDRYLINLLLRGFKAYEFKLENKTQSFVDCLERTVSNLLGGIVYYKGQIHRTDYESDNAKSVFAGTPSRVVFPRAFLWDDGFHLMSICVWSKDLCKEILTSWMNLMDEDGWIAREQVRFLCYLEARGEEIQSSIPYQFISQDPFEANPPTLLLPVRVIIKDIRRKKEFISNQTEKIQTFLENENFANVTQEELDYIQLLKQELEKLKQLDRDMVQDLEFIAFLREKLLLWRGWFERTQTHQNQTKYRWKCKGGCEHGMFLGSGMDDYPRAKKNHILQDHVDLKCWMTFFEQVLTELDNLLYEASPDGPKSEEYLTTANEHYTRLSDLISDLYSKNLDTKDNVFKDYAIKQSFTYKPKYDEYVFFRHKVDLTDEYELTETTVHIYEPGYLNLFPLFFGVISPNSREWNSIMDLMRSPDHLWTDFGIRSLSKKSEFYGTEEDYWRGAIWMPMNYLTLRGLKLYGSDPDSQTVYMSLRENVIANIFVNWEKTGYMFENYNGDEGEGQRGYPFEGWTGSTFLAVCAEIFE